MKYSIDGGLTYHTAPEGVRVIHENGTGEELHVNHTHEGIIMDVCREAPAGWENTGTSSEMTDEIIERLT